MIRLVVGGGILSGAAAVWGPLAPTLVILAGFALLLVVIASEDRTRRLEDLIRAWRGRPQRRR